jgi:hypothetical protein
MDHRSIGEASDDTAIIDLVYMDPNVWTNVFISDPPFHRR